jgi:hypothetical protein
MMLVGHLIDLMEKWLFQNTILKTVLNSEKLSDYFFSTRKNQILFRYNFKTPMISAL